MIAYDFSTASKVKRNGYYDLFSRAGKAHIATLLQKEKEFAENFNLTYATPALRKLDAKAKKGKATEEELKELKKAEKTFQGQLSNGYLIKNEKAIKVINDYLSCLDIVETDLNTLGVDEFHDVSDNSEIILGKPLTFYNLHPDQLIKDMYANIFQSPEYTLGQIEKLAKLKVNMGATMEGERVFTSRDQAEALLLNYPGTREERGALVNKLMDLRIVSNINATNFQSRLKEIIDLLMKVDAEFDLEVYEEIKNYLPQYHNKKTKYFIYMLSQFNYSQAVPVTSRITLIDLYAFYRKAVELCSC